MKIFGDFHEDQFTVIATSRSIKGVGRKINEEQRLSDYSGVTGGLKVTGILSLRKRERLGDK